jgi:hypothetical protein
MEDDEESFFGHDDIDVLEDDEPKKDNVKKEGSSESLEDRAEQPAMREADVFSESQLSSSKEMPTPTLNFSSDKSSETPRETNLEQSTTSAASGIAEASGFRQQQAQSSSKAAFNPQEEYNDVINQPEYSASIRENMAIDHMKERGMAADTFEDLRDTKRVVRWEDHPAVAQSRQAMMPGDVREYMVTELSRLDDSPKSLLDNKRD